MKKFRPTPRNRQAKDQTGGNNQYLGAAHLSVWLWSYFEQTAKQQLAQLTGIEIGAQMGETTQLLANTGIFDKLHVIEPFKGKAYQDWTWEEIQQEWQLNTRHHKDQIQLHLKHQFEMPNEFPDQTVDFCYIANLHSYEATKKALRLWLPKVRPGGIIAGHHTASIQRDSERAVQIWIGQPDQLFQDGSWAKAIQ